MTGHDDGAWREAGPAKAEGVVWAVISGREADDGVEVGREGQLEVEFFSVRPRTPDVGGEVGNWPSTYFVYEGNLDGGDSLLVGKGDGGRYYRYEG